MDNQYQYIFINLGWLLVGYLHSGINAGINLSGYHSPGKISLTKYPAQEPVYGENCQSFRKNCGQMIKFL